MAAYETQQKYHWTSACAGVTPVVQSAILVKTGIQHYGVGNEIHDILLLSFI
jgi:hypothetical protein